MNRFKPNKQDYIYQKTNELEHVLGLSRGKARVYAALMWRWTV